ncbi:hypothetical protein BC835DRAFT_1477121 [Cytidiella melzeri]|nr:hypothetical protein BC835DRAFT_1477121 [Cytidiella melzeri]
MTMRAKDTRSDRFDETPMYPQACKAAARFDPSTRPSSGRVPILSCIYPSVSWTSFKDYQDRCNVVVKQIGATIDEVGLCGQNENSIILHLDLAARVSEGGSLPALSRVCYENFQHHTVHSLAIVAVLKKDSVVPWTSVSRAINGFAVHSTYIQLVQRTSRGTRNVAVVDWAFVERHDLRTDHGSSDSQVCAWNEGIAVELVGLREPLFECCTSRLSRHKNQCGN